MTEKRTSIFENGLIWFGAGVSLAEILTGTYFASLGFGKGLLAIIIGHIIGCTMLFLAGVIGGKTRRSAMETVKMSFGEKGGIFFSFPNVLQLVGWTAIMIYDGALAANGVLHTGSWVWCLVIGALIVLWIFIGITNLGKSTPSLWQHFLSSRWYSASSSSLMAELHLPLARKPCPLVLRLSFLLQCHCPGCR